MDLRRIPPFLSSISMIFLNIVVRYCLATHSFLLGAPSRLLAASLKAIVLGLVAVPAHAQTAGMQTLDGIVAVVNGQVISTLDLQRRERFLSAQISRSQQAMPTPQALRAAVLERAVFEALMLQLAAKQGLVPNAAAVQQAINENAQQSGLSYAQFTARIQESGTSLEEYSADLKNEIAISNARDRALASKTKISEAEIDRFLREAESGVEQEVLLQVLFVPKQDSDDAQNAVRRSEAQALRTSATKASSDDAFVALQKTVTYPVGAHQVNLGYRTADKLPQLYASALETMAVGTLSPLLESSAGFYVLRLANKRLLLPQVNQTRARHILIRPSAANQEADDVAQQTIKQLHDRLTLNIDLFPALAKQFSQDGSAAKGGDLGWSLPGDMVPEFERLMEVLKEGEMGLPLRSQFGWHIVQVLERKSTELPKERLRAQARNVLRLRKQDEATGEWLEQLKAQAYIEYKRQ